MNDKLETCKLYNCEVPYLKNFFNTYKYPWEMLSKINSLILDLIRTGVDDFTELKPNVLIGKNVKIASNVTIEAPAIIGHGTEIRPGAYLRGNVITGENCVMGNSCEFKNCILLDNVQVPHYNYVGDSVLGNKSHMGAGSICSNLKSDGKNVVIHGQTDIETDLRKIGGFLADGADIGCGCVINPGTVVGKNTSVYPLTSLRGVYPEQVIVKAQDIIVVKKLS